MARVDISLAGRNYPIACDDGQEERVRRIAAYIDGKIASIGHMPTATDTHLLVMASLMLGDELFDAQSRLEYAPRGLTRFTGREGQSQLSLKDEPLPEQQLTQGEHILPA